MEAKPSLSVEVLCETVKQVWVVSREDRHKFLQARPEGTHLKSFSLFLHTQRHKLHHLCHILKPSLVSQGLISSCRQTDGAQ